MPHDRHNLFAYCAAIMIWFAAPEAQATPQPAPPGGPIAEFAANDPHSIQTYSYTLWARILDAVIEQAEHREIVTRFARFFEEVEPGVFAFAKAQSEADVRSAEDEGLTALFERAGRYGGKGCLNAVDNVLQIIAPHFEGRDAAGLSLKAILVKLHPTIHLAQNTAQRRN